MKRFFGRLIRAFLSFILVAAVFFTGFSFSTEAHAQKLTTGDVAFTGFNIDDNDAFVVVIFKDFSAGQKIRFSSKEWDGAVFSGNGGHLTWVAPAGGISRGTVLVFDHVGSAPTVNTGSIIDNSNINLSTSGDVMYAYVGPDKDTPDTFLGAIATSADEYNGTDGTTANTGLSRGTTAILLSDKIDAAQYIGDRSGDMPKGYIDKLNIISGEKSSDDNWEQYNATGNQSTKVVPFNKESFKLVQPATMKNNKMPKVVINEINYDPGGDANHNGTRDGTGDEFVELVNTSGHSLDISNWTLSDGLHGGTVRYAFKSGTVIPPNKAFVVFGAPAAGSHFGGAYLFASGSSLSLKNDGDDVIIKNANGDVVTRYHYNGSKSGESITRTPDITGNFEGHTTADADDHSISSPGTKIDGTPFGDKYAVGIRGGEGWRLVASPTQHTTFKNLFGPLWMQGVPNSDAPSASTPNLYGWREPVGGFSPLGGSGTQQSMQAGKGYMLYVFKDDDYRSPGVQGGFPKTVSSSNQENPSPVQVSVSSNDEDNNGKIDGNEGYNLLGNPYGTDISVQAVLDALRKVDGSINAHVFIYDANAGSGNGQFVAKSSGTIAPFQGFFVRYENKGVSGQATFNRGDLAASKDAQFYGRTGQTSDTHTFEINLGDGHIYDTVKIELNAEGKSGKDRLDAYKLFSLNADAINLYSTSGNGTKLAKDVLPMVNALKDKLNIPLAYRAPHSGQYTFSWEDVNGIPHDVNLYLIDHQTDRKINLRTTKNYSFNLTVKAKRRNPFTAGKVTPLPTKLASNASNESSRFTIMAVTSSSDNQKEHKKEQKEDVVLNPKSNYPNPFTPQTKTSIHMKLKHKMDVKVTIFNIVGQKVATIFDGAMDKNGQTLTWNVPPNIPSGVYLCKIKAGSEIKTLKMTLVK